jgi:hypothetical protein
MPKYGGAMLSAEQLDSPEEGFLAFVPVAFVPVVPTDFDKYLAIHLGKDPIQV